MSNSLQTKPEKVKILQEEVDKILKTHFHITEDDKENRKEAYKSFIEEDVEDLWKNFSIDGSNLVVRVFSFNPYDYKEEDKTLYINRDEKISKSKTLTFPVAKVLKAGSKATWTDEDGEEHRYKTGDFVKMKDSDARVMINPKYLAVAKSNVHKMGGVKAGENQYSPVIYNLRENLGQYTAKANPFDYLMTDDDYFTFDLHVNRIEGKIYDPELYLEYI